MDILCSNCKINVIDFSRSKNRCTSCLDAANIRNNRYMKAHPERRYTQGHKYYLFHKDKIIEVSKQWHKNNPIKVKEKKKRYNDSHKEKNLLYSKKYYSTLNGIEKRNNWRHNHPEKNIIWGEKRRARIKSIEGNFTKEEWISCCNKYDNKCLWCKSNDKKLTADHVIPVVHEGTNYISNIQPLCKSCNSKKGTKIIDFRLFEPDILEYK